MMELSKSRKYRFFYHYNKPNNKMTVHFRKKCYIVGMLHVFVIHLPNGIKFNNLI